MFWVIVFLLVLWIVGSAILCWYNFEHLVFAKFNWFGYILFGPGWCLLFAAIFAYEFFEDLINKARR